MQECAGCKETFLSVYCLLCHLSAKVEMQKNKKKIMKEVKAWTLSLYACISKASNLAVI